MFTYEDQLSRLYEIAIDPTRHGNLAPKRETIAIIDEIESGLTVDRVFGTHENEHLRRARGFALIGSIQPALVEVLRALRKNDEVRDLLVSQ